MTSRTFDLSSNAKTQTDAKGKVTTLAYDSRGRRVSTTDRINATTTWTFDAAGNELSMTDAENQTTVYTYDNKGQRTTIQWPDHVAGQAPGGANYGIEATAYDAAGRVLRKTNQLGDTIAHVHDMASRMLAREYRTLANSPSGIVSNTDTFTFDAASRMLTGVKGLYSNTVALAYDQGGRKATEALTIAGQTYTTATVYDTAGRVSQLTYPDGSVVARTYDSRNLLSTIAYGGGNIDTRTYDAGGRLTSETLGNGQVVTRAYLTGDNLPALIANAAVGSYTYGWDANKNKTSETITGAMSGYGFNVPTGGYDDQNRLTAWNRTNGTKNQSWALSPVGDWNSFVDAGVTQARTHGPTHEILTIGNATVTHDSRGNMTQDEQAKQFTWDADGMLASATVPAGSSTGVEGTHTYQYDVLGRRVRKTTGGAGASDTVFVRDGQTVITEYTATTAAASSLRKYVNASYVDEPVLLIDRTASGAVGAGTEERFYYHRNQQYSITALTDNSGTVAERYAYTAYGEPTILDAPRTTSFINNPYLYTARAYDAESGLYYFRARMYEGRKGRFLSHDPILYPDGNNTYAGWFAARGMDPSGLEDWTGTGIDPNNINTWPPGTVPQYYNWPSWLPLPPEQRPLLLYNGSTKKGDCDFGSGGREWFKSVGMIPDEIDIGKVDEKSNPITDNMLSGAIGEGNCISTLFIADHGMGCGGQSCGTNSNAIDSEISTLCGRMCCGSTIVLGGCDSGNLDSNGNTLGKRILDKCKNVRQVKACTGPRNYPAMGNKSPPFVPYCAGGGKEVTYERGK